MIFSTVYENKKCLTKLENFMISKNNPMNAVFLDRDGTIIEEVNYLDSFEKLKIYPFSREAISILKESNFKVFIITNQSGIGKGYFSEKFVKEVNKYLCEILGIDEFFYCPHLPEDNCNCRKPKTGLIEKALEKYPEVDLKNSFFVGDKEIDIETGKNLNLKTILVLTGYGKQFIKNSKADYIVKSLYYASLLIRSMV